jgi:hypothetical protein
MHGHHRGHAGASGHNSSGGGTSGVNIGASALISEPLARVFAAFDRRCALDKPIEVQDMFGTAAFATTVPLPANGSTKVGSVGLVFFFVFFFFFFCLFLLL